MLLNNEKFPFRLGTPLHADLTIGIDVKHHTACYTFLNNTADSIRQAWQISGDKERLDGDSVTFTLVSNISELISNAAYGYPIKHVAIHRDGRLFETEKEGIRKAQRILESQGVESITMLDIQKSSPAPSRIFMKDENDRIFNPPIGIHHFLNSHTAYLCSTGNEYRLQGTVNPLCIHYHPGEMDFEKILEDVYALSNLTFTKLDSCSRLPLSIKLTDLKLKSIASQYDSDKLKVIKEFNDLVNQ